MNKTSFKLGLVGFPVKHSSSKKIHEYLGVLKGVEITYDLMECPPCDLKELTEHIHAEGCDGFNVTIPHKCDIIDYIGKLDDAASAIGAVNTCVRDGDTYAGYNTDAWGFMEAVRYEGLDIANSIAVVLGAGGAARAVVYTLLKLNCRKIYIVNRTRQNAEKLASYFGSNRVTVTSVESIIAKKERFIAFQCTSLGLSTSDDAPVTNDAFYKLCDFGMDLIPIAIETDFMFRCRRANVSNINGMSMLIFQAVRAFELFTGVKITSDDYRCLLEKFS